MTSSDERTERNARNSRIIERFRANQGDVGDLFGGGALLLLSTIGAKSGELRVNPMAYVVDGERWLVFASKAGAPVHPDWYHNLVANPTVTVEMGAETFEATATPLTGDERDQAYATQAARAPVFVGYQEKTTRKIPVVALTRNG